MRPGGSRTTAHVTLRPVRTAAPVALTVAPDRGRRLSGGAYVAATLVARLLGMRLLTIDAEIALVPADARTLGSAADARPLGSAADARPVRTSPRRALATGSRAAGPGLARAVRTMDEGAELLAEARRGARGSSGRR